MGKSLLAALCAMLLSFFPAVSGSPPEPPGGACRCLAVGMDLFLSEGNTAPCSANNAEIMAALFASFLPEGTRVTRSVNGPGSEAGLESLIAEAFGDAREGDTAYLYLSTHGVAWEEGGGMKTALILSDGTEEAALAPERLREMMDRIPGKKVLILDCCHAGAMLPAFAGAQWRAAAGCAPREECFFMSAGEATGMGYFTAALENALRASDAGQIDPDGDGQVTLGELAARIREIYGVSEAMFLPDAAAGDAEPLFFLPGERGGAERLAGLAFGEAAEEDGLLTLSFRFRTETDVKVEYRLVPMGENGWDFAGAGRMPDRERTGQTRGLLSPGEKERSIRVSREKLGGAGAALLEIISMRGLYRQVPVPEATRVIRFSSDEMRGPEP